MNRGIGSQLPGSLQWSPDVLMEKSVCDSIHPPSSMRARLAAERGQEHVVQYDRPLLSNRTRKEG